MALLDDLIKKFREDAFGKNGRVNGQRKWFNDNLPDVKVDDLYLSIALAHDDMAEKERGNINEIKKASIEWWYNQFSTDSPFDISNMPDFDKWHWFSCDNYSKHMSGQSFAKKFDITFGKAQRVLNMTFKYLYCTDAYKKDVEKIVQFLHITLDEYTMRWYKEIGKTIGVRICDMPEWNKLTKYVYICITKGGEEYCIQGSIRCFLKTNEYEYTINIDKKSVELDDEKKDRKIKISIDVGSIPFFAEFIIGEAERIRTRIETLFIGLNNCYKLCEFDVWGINSAIKESLKNKIEHFIEEFNLKS